MENKKSNIDGCVPIVVTTTDGHTETGWMETDLLNVWYVTPEQLADLKAGKKDLCDVREENYETGKAFMFSTLEDIHRCEEEFQYAEECEEELL